MGHKNTSYWPLMPDWADFLPHRICKVAFFDKNCKSGFNLQYFFRVFIILHFQPSLCMFTISRDDIYFGSMYREVGTK